MRQTKNVIRWAGIELPGKTETHFGIVGKTGSGKSLMLQSLMRCVVPTIFDHSDAATAQRALVFDPESKFVPFLQELAGVENVHIVNPFDLRSRPWDLANEIDDLATAQEMASIFIPDNKEDTQPFWQRTARGILSGVFKALHLKAKGRWSLRHVFHIATHEDRLMRLLTATNQTQALFKLLDRTELTLFNVLTEVQSQMDMLGIVAALWDNSVEVLKAKPFTLKEWLSERSVLVFGRPTQLEDTILSLNRVMIKRASQLIRAPLAKDHIKSRGRTWIFLDELRNIGNLPGLEKLLTEGRSRGARVAITFQDIDGLREVYGQRVAEEIANQCDTMSYLRCTGTTAKWASEQIGRSEHWEEDYHAGGSTTHGEGRRSSGANWGTNARRNISDAVLESELSGLPLPKEKSIDGKRGAYVQGWHIIPALESVFATRESDAWYAFEEEKKGEFFVARPGEHQILRPWDEEIDWAELGVGSLVPVKPVKPEPQPEPELFPPIDVESLRGQ